MNRSTDKHSVDDKPRPTLTHYMIYNNGETFIGNPKLSGGVKQIAPDQNESLKHKLVEEID